MNTNKNVAFPVAIYGAGTVADSLFCTLAEKYNVVCFCDGNKEKWGKRLFDLQIMSLDEAVQQYAHLRVFVTTNPTFRFEVMDEIIVRGFPPERIINYEPYKKYVSCAYLESRIGFSEKVMAFCPSSFGQCQSPLIPYTGDAQNNIESFLNLRDMIIEELSTGTRNDQLQIKHNCVKCPNVKEGFWPINRRISDICLAVKHHCNLKCSYCVETCIDKSQLTGKEHLDEALDTLEFMTAQKIIDPLAIVCVAPTEISIHPYRDKILKAMSPYVCQFTTNAVVYSEKIAQDLKKGGKICSSLDAGTPETFKRIKAVDCFYKVCDNLMRYSKIGTVEVKYIFLTGVNDNDIDVESFIKVCTDISPASIWIARDTTETKKMLDRHTMDMIVKMIITANKRGINANFSPLMFTGDEYQYINNVVKKLECKHIM